MRTPVIALLLAALSLSSACIDMFTGITLNEDGSAWLHLRLEAGEELGFLIKEKLPLLMDESELRQRLQAEGGHLKLFEQTVENGNNVTELAIWYPDYHMLAQSLGMVLGEEQGQLRLAFPEPLAEMGGAVNQMKQQLRHMGEEGDKMLADQFVLMEPMLKGLHLDFRFEVPGTITDTNLIPEGDHAGRWVFDFDRDVAGKTPGAMMTAMLEWSRTAPFVRFEK